MILRDFGPDWELNAGRRLIASRASDDLRGKIRLGRFGHIALTLRRILDALTLAGRGRGSLRAEVLVLRHENAIVRRGNSRPKLA